MNTAQAFICFFVVILTGVVLAEPAGSRREDRVSVLDFNDLELSEALRILAQETGLNLTANDAVRCRVTLHIEDLPAREALAAVLETCKAAFEENGPVIKVLTEEEYQARHGRPFNQRVSSRMFVLRGMKAGTAAALLERMKGPLGRIVAEESSGTVYVEDTPQKLAEMEGYLEEVDVPLTTVTFELFFTETETAASGLRDVITPGVGQVTPDILSNKIFVTDTEEGLVRVRRFLYEVDRPREPAVLDVHYAKAEDLAEIARRYLTKTGSIEVNKKGNQLIVIDTEPRLRQLRKIVQSLDRKEPEVLIEAKIVQVVLRDEFRMGVDWEAIFSGAHGLRVSSAMGGTGTQVKGSIAIGTLSDDNYRAVIEALGQARRSQVLSSPRIAVLNHQEARILVGSTKPYVTSTTTTTATGPTVSEDVKFIDVGVKLVVTPTIHGDGFVTMKIRPEVSSAVSSIRTGQNNVIPIVDTSEVETTVRVKDGVTVVIGGLIKDENSRDGAGVPVLGDIPLVGRAFRNESKSKERNEIMIFLTPRIMSGDVKQEPYDKPS